MDIFFVLSSYFITALLLRDIGRFGHIRYLSFYRRRFSRILPAFVAMASVYIVYRALIPSGAPFSHAVAETAVALAYFTNWWHMYVPSDNYFLGHTWSLSVEEQFYLIWPATFALFAKWMGIGRHTVFLLLFAAVLGWAWRGWLTFTGASWERLYFGTDMHADAFFVGAALATWLNLCPAGSLPNVERLLPRLASPLLIYGIIVSFVIPETSGFQFYLGAMLCGVLPGALLILIVVRSSGTILHRVLEVPPALFLGKIFYGIYLWHFPIIRWLVFAHVHALGRLMIALPLSVVLAGLSYIYIEQPFMRHFPVGPSQKRASSESA
jgi:peptidoglycan/LPS O-acetylase OafA/YrhL